MNKVNFKPNRMSTVSPYLIVKSVYDLIDFAEKVFSAVADYVIEREEGKIMHAQIVIDDSIIMAGDSTEDFGAFPCSLYVYVKDCDLTYNKAVDYGCDSIMEPTTLDQTGDRMCGIKDNNDNIWWIATQIEELTTEEMKRRWADK